MKVKTILCAVGLLGVMTSAAYGADVNTVNETAVRGLLAEEPGVAMNIGTPNSGLSDHFSGQTYVDFYQDGLPAATVTFIDGAHTHWHQHGTDQLLIAESGVGYVQIEGQEPVKLLPGKTVVIPPNTRHWHGAAPHHTFQHVTVMKSAPDMTTTWFEPVKQEEFDALK